MLERLAAQLAGGAVTAAALTDAALAKADDGEGPRAFLSLRGAEARAEAAAIDQARKAGRAVPRYAGIPFAVKDLFDESGAVTRAGSRILAGAPKAAADADAIARLKRAGFISIGRTNMTEFAYSGVGLNPHHGTPRAAFDRATGRAPGGSSSGAGVAVADGMVGLAIGSDTGGSCRIPAAYNGVTGYKPTARRVPRAGVYPLSPSLDSIGPLAGSVADCAIADAIMAGDRDGAIAAKPLSSLRLAVLANYALDGLDPEVAADFARVLAIAGPRFEDVVFRDAEALPSINRNGGIVAAEAWALHGARIEAREAEYDPRVARRMRAGAAITAEELSGIRQRRAGMTAAFAPLMEGYDALILPAVMNIAPPLADFARDDDYGRLNAKSLRNTYLANFLDACSISLPMHRPGAAPTGLMLIAPGGRDRDLFAASLALETALSLTRA